MEVKTKLITDFWPKSSYSRSVFFKNIIGDEMILNKKWFPKKISPTNQKHDSSSLKNTVISVVNLLIENNETFSEFTNGKRLCSKTGVEKLLIMKYGRQKIEKLKKEKKKLPEKAKYMQALYDKYEDLTSFSVLDGEDFYDYE